MRCCLSAANPLLGPDELGLLVSDVDQTLLDLAVGRHFSLGVTLHIKDNTLFMTMKVRHIWLSLQILIITTTFKTEDPNPAGFDIFSPQVPDFFPQIVQIRLS